MARNNKPNDKPDGFDDRSDSHWRDFIPKPKIMILSFMLLALLFTVFIAMQMLTDNVIQVNPQDSSQVAEFRISADVAFERGVMLTALAGVISSLLSFIGLIVKGIIDDLQAERGTRDV